MKGEERNGVSGEEVRSRPRAKVVPWGWAWFGLAVGLLWLVYGWTSALFGTPLAGVTFGLIFAGVELAIAAMLTQ